MAKRRYVKEAPVCIGPRNLLELADKVIGRYFNLSGFLNMLKTSELRFNKISNFEDKAEGVPQYKEIIDGLEQSEKNVSPEYAKNRKENIIKTIDNYYASCWTMRDHESYLMWKNYTSFNEGVLVLTTVKPLIQSIDLQSYEEISDNSSDGIGKIVQCFFGEVDYDYKLEYRSDHIKAFGKSKYFSEENEFRIIIYHHPIIEENELRRTIKSFSFINSIICSPKSSIEFLDLIKQIAINYSLPESLVKESEMKQNNSVILNEFVERNH